MSAHFSKAVVSRRRVRSSSPSTKAARNITSEVSPIMWSPPSCGDTTPDSWSRRSRSFDARKHAPTGHAESPRAAKVSTRMQQHQISQPLSFPLQMQSQQSQHGGLQPESLAKRLSQAEQGLAEKDQRIAALEAYTRKLAERLELAEGLTATPPKGHSKEPGTTASTRSTSGSTSCSLGSVGSAVTRKTPRAPNSHFLGTKSASEGVAKRQANCWGANSSPFASASDVDVVFRRSELLLKAMAAAVAHGEKSRLPRQPPSVARNSPRSRELRSSSQLCF